MSVKKQNTAGGERVVPERPAAVGAYASLFKKINLNPVSELSALAIPDAVMHCRGEGMDVSPLRVYLMPKSKS